MKEFYVYVYADPITHCPFYVGKGTGKRWKGHWNNSHNMHVNRKIEKIRKKGMQPHVEKIYITNCEDSALELEEFLIDQCGIINNGGILCNQDLGGKGTCKYKFDTAFYDRLGRESDKQIADDYGCCDVTVHNIRKSLDIPSFRSGDDYRVHNKTDVSDEVIQSLGTMSDKGLADKFNIHKSSIYRWRSARHIDAFKPTTLLDQIRPYLGDFPDQYISDRFDVTKPAVMYWRRLLGIPSCREQGKIPRIVHDKTVYILINIHTGEEIEGDRGQLSDQLDVGMRNISSVVTGKKQSIKRIWYLKDRYSHKEE